MQFRDKVNLLVSTLGKHYGGHLRIKSSEHEISEIKKHQKKWDDPLAFEEFVNDLNVGASINGQLSDVVWLRPFLVGSGPHGV